MLVELDDVIKWCQKRTTNTEYWDYEYDENG